MTGPVECGAGLYDGVRVVAHCGLERGHTGYHLDVYPAEVEARAWAPTVPVNELPHMPGCTDPDHRPLTSLCTTEPYRTGIPWASA
jgi:hypothetical protein